MSLGWVATDSHAARSPDELRAESVGESTPGTTATLRVSGDAGVR